MIERLHKHIRVLYVGMRGAFSLPPLHALLGAGYSVCAVLVPGDHAQSIIELRPAPSRSLLPIINPHVEQTIVQRAWQHTIPVFAIGQFRAAARDQIAALKPDVAVVACWDRRIPQSVLDVPPRGFWNIHPSLLPAYRGPAPLFWQLRHGLREIGVTLHRMDAHLDTGPIIDQAFVTLPDGVSGPAADTLLATAGGELLIAALQAARKYGIPARPQRGEPSSAPLPTADDFQLDRTWSAQRAFNFMRGTAHWQQPYPLIINDERFLLRAALRHDHAATLPAPFTRDHETILVQFAPGVLHAAL